MEELAANLVPIVLSLWGLLPLTEQLEKSLDEMDEWCCRADDVVFCRYLRSLPAPQLPASSDSDAEPDFMEALWGYEDFAAKPF